MTNIYLTGKEPLVANIIAAAFPSYHGKLISLTAAEHVNARDYGWQGGSRTEHVFVCLDQQKCIGRMPEETAFTGKIEGSDNVALPPNVALVTKTTSGSRISVQITVHPSTLNPMMLPLPTSDTLTEDENKVLYYTRSLKSSYGGVKNYRQAESGLSPSRWEAAKALLIEKGLLNKAGALTVSGKTAASGLRF